jgi:holliday junction DNA helicase RuvA
MIGLLRGRIRRKEPGAVLLEVGGVGYAVSIPLSTFYRLGDAGSEAELLVHTHVREDALALFGFLGADEKQLFELLIAVSGVGPRLAVNILSGIEVPDLLQALGSADLARLTRIPGVGKKTAERLVVELRDRVKSMAPGAAEPSAAGAGAAKDDLISALANLGYSRADVEKGVDRALREGQGERFEDLLRRTLQILSGRR